jgi:hypothetical protein
MGNAATVHISYSYQMMPDCGVLRTFGEAAATAHRKPRLLCGWHHVISQPSPKLRKTRIVGNPAVILEFPSRNHFLSCIP